MKNKRWIACGACAALGTGFAAGQEPGTDSAENNSKPPASFSDWFEKRMPQVLKDGRVLLNVRTRYEHADQSGLAPSNAFTVRTRLGYQTGDYYGFNGLLEFEDVTALGNDDNFNQAGLTGPGRTVIADVETTEVNQAILAFNQWDTGLKLGRQRIILDKARFVGNVGWRQNEQTYDAFAFSNESLEDLRFFYGYVFNVNRIVGDGHPAGDFDSDSHLFNISYAGWPYGTLTGYSYLIDLENDAPANSANTFGASFDGAAPVGDDFKILYRAEYARQFDTGDNPIDYEADYYHFKLGGSYKRFSLGAGYELLGSDGGAKGFATPLATLHAYNGWADAFLGTPNDGLQDLYVEAGVKLPWDMPFKVVYHNFESDDGNTDYGDEIDAVLSKNFGDHWSALVKYAHYEGGRPDRQKFWAQLEFKF